jgi:hypothetical protein
MPSHTRRISTACLIGLASLTGACADANLAGPNVPGQPAYSLAATAGTGPWTASGPGVTLVSDGTAGDAVMSYVFVGGSQVFQSGSWTFTTTAAQTGTVTLPWSYSGNHNGGPVEVYAVVNNALAGTLINTVTPQGFSFNGTFTFNVNAGDTYGFGFGGSTVFPPAAGMVGTFTVHEPEQQDPTTKEDCKDGEWVVYEFSNQGQCIRFVETGDDSR